MLFNFQYKFFVYFLFFLLFKTNSFSNNLLKNFSFEENQTSGVVPYSWSLPSWSFVALTSTDNFYSGSFSLKISSNNVSSIGRNFFVYQDVYVKPFYTYYYGVKVFKNNQSDFPAGIAIKSASLNWNENWYLRTSMSTATISNSSSWQDIYTSTTIPLGISKLRVHLVVRNTTPQGSCEVYFDDVFFYKDYISPSAVSDLMAFIKDNNIYLSWSSPGNDEDKGELFFGSEYIIKYTTCSCFIYEMLSSTSNADVIISTYNVAANQQQIFAFNVEPQEGTTYYFCLWTKDNSDNYSSVSNLAVLFLPINLPSWIENEIKVSTNCVRWVIRDNSLIEDEIYISSKPCIFSRLSPNLGPLYGKNSVIMWNEENLLPNTIYTRFIEIKTHTNSFWSLPYSISTLSLAPDDFKAVCKINDNKPLVELTWSSSIAAGYVVVFSSMDFFVNTTTLCVLSENCTFYIHNDIKTNTTYYYKIYSYNKNFVINYDSFNMASVLTVPGSVKLFAKAISTNSIKLFWDTKEDVNGFKIYCGKTNKLIAKLSKEVTYYIEKGLDANTEYKRYIVAYNTYDGLKSNEVSLYTLSNSVDYLSIESVYYDKILIIYNTNGNPVTTEYQVLVSSNNFSVNFSSYVSIQTNLLYERFLIENLLPNTTYWIKIRAKNKDGIFTEFSYIVSTTTLRIISPIITQFATRGPNSAYDEFVELWNCLCEEIDISGFKIEYFNGNSWISKIIIPENTKLNPYSFYLISSSSEYFTTIQSDLYHKSYLNLADGEETEPRGLRIVSNLGQVIDRVVYEANGGTFNEFAEGQLTSVSCGVKPTNNSVTRRKNEKGFYVDSDNNYNDFILSLRNPRNSSFSIYGITDLEVSITDKEGQVKLSWTALSIADKLKYRIKYSTYNFTMFSAEDSFNLELTTSSGRVCIYIDFLEPSLTYYFAVIFKDIDDNWKTWIKDNKLNINSKNFAYSLDLPPNPPEDIKIISLNKKLKITWKHPSCYDIDKYLVFISTRSFESLKEAILISSVSFPLNETLVFGLENNLTYYISVITVDRGNSYDILLSTYFIIKSGIPKFSSPKNLSFSYSDKSVNLYWEDDFNEDILGYNIYYSSKNFDFSLIGFSQSLNYEIPLEKFLDGYYCVSKLDKENSESLSSNIIEIFLDVLPPRVVFFEEFTLESISKGLNKFKIKIEDDKFVNKDLRGKVVEIKGYFREIDSNIQKEIEIDGELNRNIFDGYIVFDFENFNLENGFEYYFWISDGKNLKRFPDDGWFKVIDNYTDKENYFVSLSNPKLIFKNVKELKVFTSSGRELFSVGPGVYHNIIWIAKDKEGRFLESGVYIYKLVTLCGKKRYGYIVVIK
ncbi:MAG: hypothetical protein RMJ67_05530 [Elusimicrobiota bacterium]|nr:hypothetical protein [Endomicrobiia bacterium]MDW8165951.1 hypothetical protein [Elusimicrobiota bacterium]